MKSFNIAKQLGLPKLPKYFLRIQAVLESMLPEQSSPLYIPLKRVITAPSKRLRSCLLIASHGRGSEVNEKALTACAAIELIHLGSLVHDDIMDDANSRWGIETVHKKEGLNQAILVGDYLFAKANFIAATVSLEVATIVAQTITELCDGQARELADAFNVARTEESYMKAIGGKTASLLGAACRVGAVVAGATRSQSDELEKYGRLFGMSFQLIDDVLDLLSSETLLGKPTGSDVRDGVYTLPLIIALQGSERANVLKDMSPDSEGLATTLIRTGAVRETVFTAQKFSDEAQKVVVSFMSHEFQNLPANYLKWATQNLVDDIYKPLNIKVE